MPRRPLELQLNHEVPGTILTPVEQLPLKQGTGFCWRFRCRCGREIIRQASRVHRCITRSCGCQKRPYQNKAHLVNQQRLAQIRELLATGHSHRDIAHRLGISHQRVGQIVHKHALRSPEHADSTPAGSDR